MVRDTRIAAGAEKDRVELLQGLDPVFGHQAAGLVEALATPVELREAVLDPEPGTGSLEDPETFRHHLPADPVAGNDRNPEC